MSKKELISVKITKKAHSKLCKIQAKRFLEYGTKINIQDLNSRIILEYTNDDDYFRVKNIVKEAKTILQGHYGKKLKKLILYGSWARGEGRKESDIDLLIVLKGRVDTLNEIREINALLIDLNLKYDELLSVHPISENEYLQSKNHYYAFRLISSIFALNS